MCFHCNDTGVVKSKLGWTKDYCDQCLLGAERISLELWAGRLFPHIEDTDALWSIYMHGKIAGTNELSNQFKKGSPP